jgi:DNA polymerase III gamma/tau subunit
VFTRDDKPKTVLFTGPSGCGKTTLARICATMVGCDLGSIQEYNSANTRGIDSIREINENMQYAPMVGSVKVYILDEVHMITGAAANALLKMLEDTPKHVFFFLCTTDPEKLLKAIRTRCMAFEVKSLSNPQVTKLVKDTILNVLGEDDAADFPPSVIQAVVKNADGCARQAMILLDSVIDILDEKVALAALAAATATETASIELCRCLLEDRQKRWDDARFLLKGLGDDHEKLRYAILGYLDAVLMSDNCKDPARVSGLIDCFRESYMYSGKAALHSDCFNACQL